MKAGLYSFSSSVAGILLTEKKSIIEKGKNWREETVYKKVDRVVTYWTGVNFLKVNICKNLPFKIFGTHSNAMPQSLWSLNVVAYVSQLQGKKNFNFILIF